MKHFLKRSLAYFIDCSIAYTLVMLVIQWAIFSNIRGSIGIDDEWFKNSWNMEFYVLSSISVPVWMYFIYFDSRKTKGTFGKRLLKLQVLDANSQQMSFGKSFARTLLKLAPWEIAHIGVVFPIPMHYATDPQIRILTIVGIALFMAYALSILLNAQDRSLYDWILGTRVVSSF